MNLNPHVLLPAISSLIAGVFLCLLGWKIIGKNFKSQEFQDWFTKRKLIIRLLGPGLIVASIIIYLRG